MLLDWGASVNEITINTRADPATDCWHYVIRAYGGVHQPPRWPRGRIKNGLPTVTFSIRDEQSNVSGLEAATGIAATAKCNFCGKAGKNQPTWPKRHKSEWPLITLLNWADQRRDQETISVRRWALRRPLIHLTQSLSVTTARTTVIKRMSLQRST